MAGRGKFCLGYSNDPAIYADRVRNFTAVTRAANGRLVDADGLTVEDFGLQRQSDDDPCARAAWLRHW